MSTAEDGHADFRLPLYGPLEIKNLSEYFEKCKEKFYTEYNKSPQPGLLTINDFKILHTLGQGTFGKIKLTQLKSNDTYFAMKVLQKQKLVEFGEIKHTLLEKKMLQSIDFPLAVRMEHFFQDGGNLYFVMPFISGGDLFTQLRKLKRFKESLTKFYAAQVVLGLQYLQNLSFVHRDIKPENILIDHLGFLKITDFGFAKYVNGRTYTFCGTPPYIAPEVIEGIGYARSVDWWSLGVLIYEMTAGHMPFKSRDNIRLFTKILYDTIYYPPFFGPKLENLLRKLLQRDVTRRFGNLKDGAEDIKRHEWFNKTDWLKMLNRKTVPPFVPKNAGFGDVSNFPEVIATSTITIHDTDDYVDAFKDF